jgi:two-component system sensor histidine kinase/response regulator
VPSALEPMWNDAETTLRRRFTGTPVLLVEDNPVNREVALELLHSVGLAVDTATNGWEAVERNRQRSYDLILMDMQMPVMDGMAAARAIRALPSCSTTPIVAFTANAFSENRDQCREAGMDDFIVKPVNPELLYQTLLQWLPRNGGVRTPTAVAAPAPEVSRSHHALPLEVVLAGLHGVDSSYGLKVMRGDAIRYANLLSKFVERSIVDVDTLQTCMRAGNIEESAHLAHSLRGGAGSVGAVEFANAVAALEAAWAGGLPAEEQHAMLNLLIEVHSNLVTAVRALPNLTELR